MKIFVLALAAIATVAVTIPASAQVAVQGYYRRDGTYVSPHVRTSPNGICSDNYSGCR